MSGETILEHHELFGSRRDHVRAGVGHDNIVLDANAELSWQVDSRLDRDDVAGIQEIATAWSQSWSLMNAEPDSVSEGVAEVTCESCLGKTGPCYAIELARLHCWAHGSDGGFLSLQDRLIGLPGSPRDSTDRHRSGKVGAISSHDAAKIKCHHVSVAQFSS